MYRYSRRVCGSFLLNQRLFADWWHASHREELHQKAKGLLNEALEAVIAPPRPPLSTENGSDERSSPPLSLFEVNALLTTFVSSHNTPDLSAALQYIREQLGEELTPYHFHALLRVFNYHHDVNNAVQLLEVMIQSGATTLETYARMVDSVHVLSPPDALARMLQLITLAQKAFGSLVMDEGVGSDGATVALYSASEEARQARQNIFQWEGHKTSAIAAAEGEADKKLSMVGAPPLFLCQGRSAPLLSSLLYHCSTTSHRCTVASCFVVALWIRALGVELSDWDVLSVLTSVLANPDEFPRVCAAFGYYGAYPRGTVCVRAVVDRLTRLGVVETSTPRARSSKGTHAGQSKGGPETAPIASHPSSAPTSPTGLTALVEAMRASLRDAGVDEVKVNVRIPFVNAQTNNMEELVAMSLQPLAEMGVGPHRYNAGHLYHALSLVLSTVGDDIGALQLLMRAVREEQRYALKREQLPMIAVSGSPRDVETVPSASPTASPQQEDPQSFSGEPFRVPVQYLMDMGTLLHRMSATTLHEVQKPFHATRRAMVLELSDSTAITTTATASPSSSVLELASCRPAAPSARDLATVGQYEVQFIHTVAEARATLQRAIDGSSAAGKRGQIARSTQFLFFQLAQFCSRHPPRNPKLTDAGLEERTRWGRYLDARDTSLALFGSARQSRDSMKYLFYNNNRLPELRNEAVIAKDFADVHQLFFGTSTPSSSTLSQAELQEAVRRTRTTPPHLCCCDATVPRYLWDPAVYNPYPAAQLANRSSAFMHPGSTSASGTSPFSAAEIDQTDETLEGNGGSEANDSSEFFVELWHTLLDKTTAVGRNEAWYLQNTDMFLMLLRCLLHRLDWEAAVHLTRKMTQHTSYTYLMDHELAVIFREIGDPAGCLAFKVATKLFDGRITKDGQTKREKFHQEQFS